MVLKYSLGPQLCLFVVLSCEDVCGVTQTIICLTKRIVLKIFELEGMKRLMSNVRLFYF